MRLDLSADEAHWLKYTLVVVINQLPPSSSIRAILYGILKRLDENNREGDRHG